MALIITCYPGYHQYEGKIKNTLEAGNNIIDLENKNGVQECLNRKLK